MPYPFPYVDFKDENRKESLCLAEADRDLSKLMMITSYCVGLDDWITHFNELETCLPGLFRALLQKFVPTPISFFVLLHLAFAKYALCCRLDISESRIKLVTFQTTHPSTEWPN